MGESKTKGVIMQAHVSASHLQSLTQRVASIAARSKTLPILANVLLSLKGNTIAATATNTETEIMARVRVPDGAIAHEGSTCIDASKLTNILKALQPDDLVQLRLDDTHLLLSANRSRFKLATMPADAFPNVEAGDESWQITNSPLNRAELIKEMGRVSFAMATADVRQYLNGMFLEFKGARLNLVATDGHRLAMSYLASRAPTEASAIVPRKAVTELIRVLSAEKDEQVQISVSANHIQARTQHTRVTSSLLTGQFPNYERVIPASNYKGIELHRAAIQSVVKRTLITTSQNNGIRMVFDKQLSVESLNELTEGCEEQMEVKWDHGPMTYGINGAYLLDILSAADDDTLTLAFSGEQHALLVRPSHAQHYQFVAMPMRL